MAQLLINSNVQSYFINVNDGDGAVHLLRKGPTGPIQKAILIDGGRDEALHSLVATIEEIREVVKSKFKFDAVVITHWDGDHYRALTTMLNRDLRANSTSSYVKPGATFYYPHTAAKKMANANMVVENDELYLRIKLDKNKFDKRKLCRAVATTDTIGYDLFTNQVALTIGNGKFIPSLKEAYKQCPNLKDKKQPVFLIVGADENFIDGQPSFKRPGDSVKSGENSRAINAASIMAIIIWPTQDVETLLRVSLYTGGDAEEEREEHLLAWMTKGMDLAKGKVTLDVVKAGHHGSHFAMPETMLNFQNQAFVISAGEKHGHPSFSVLYFLLMAAEIRKANQAKWTPKVYCTRLPYWLKMPADTLTGTDFNIQTVFSYRDGTAKLMSALFGLENDKRSKTFILTAFKKCMVHMKNVFYLQYKDNLKELEKTANGMTSLAMLKDWKKPIKANVLDEYLKAVESAQKGIESKWRHHGQPLKDWDNKVSYVFAEASSSDKVDVYAKKPLPSSPVASQRSNIVNPISPPNKRPMVAAGNTHASALASSYGKGTKKLKINSFVMGASPFSQAEEWTIRLFVDALLKSYQTSPPPSTFERFKVDAQSSAYLTFLLDNYFAVASTILLSGKSEVAGKPELHQIDIELAVKNETGSTIQTLAFTTDRSSRAVQFGHDAASFSETSPGYDDRMSGMILGLDQHHTTGRMTLAQLAALIHFPLSSAVMASIGRLPLKPIHTHMLEKPQSSLSGLWLVPAASSRAILRLAMELDTDQDGVSVVEDFLKDKLGNVEVNKITITGVCVAETSIEPEDNTVNESEVEWNSALSLQGNIAWKSKNDAPPGFEGIVVISFTNVGFEIALQLDQKTSDIFSDLVNWVQKKMPAQEDSLTNSATDLSLQSTDDVVEMVKGSLSTLTKGFDARSVKLSFNSQLEPEAFEINIETALPLPRSGEVVPFLVSLQWNPGVYKLSAELWGGLELYDQLPPALDPYPRPAHDIYPRTDKAVFKIPIMDLIGQYDLAIPKGIPDTITEAAMRLMYSKGNSTVFITSTIACSPEGFQHDQIKPADPPLLRFDEVRLALMLDFLGPNRDFSIEFDAVTVITTKAEHRPTVITEQVDDSIILRTKVQYANDGSGDSLWNIVGAVENVKLANLYDLLASDGANSAIMDVMANLHIAYAGVTYEYRSGRPSALYLNGTIRLGTPISNLHLDLAYSHLSKGSRGLDGKEAEESGWSFAAHLGATPRNEHQAKQLFTAADLFNGLLEDVNDLPEIVKTLQIQRSELSIDLVCKSIFSGNEKRVIFALTITIKTFSITLAQIRSYGEQRAKVGGQDDPGVGRLLTFSLSKLPELPKVPVVGRVDQIPLDQLGVIWANRDITSKELIALNENIFKQHPLLIKQAKKDSTTALKLASGLHFQVVLLEGGLQKLVLDHVVSGKRKKVKAGSESSQGIENNGNGVNTKVKQVPSDNEEDKQSVAPMCKTFGPLSIRNIGLSVGGPKHTIVRITLDATVRLGPVSFALLGFRIAIDLGNVKSLGDLLRISPTVSVKGMEVAFDKPPTRLGGLIARFEDRSAGSEGFEGAIAVSVAAWSAMAGGRYQELRDGTKSLFVFGMLQGTIAEFGCAQLNGLMGGFGYNSLLKLPTLAMDVPLFPFIALNRPGTDTSGSIMEQMLLITDRTREFIKAVRDEMWLVAGVGIHAFQLIDAQVLLALTLGAEAKFQLMATATASFPKSLPGLKAQRPPTQLLVVDIAISAVVDPFHGIFIVTGDLTPRSFILSPSCRMTGSFAMAYFLPGSPYVGDFVISIGGYHPHFKPPSHYPVVASRVGIEWEYDSQLCIKGEAYFALSPQAIMAGGRLDIVLDKSWVTVRFSAWADFLMYFHPFYFEADIGITILASVSIPLLFWTLHLGPLEFSARLVLRGPPVSGEAYLHLWRWDVQVVFGPPPIQSPPLKLGEFIRMIKNLPIDAEEATERKVPDLLLSFTGGVVTTNATTPATSSMAKTTSPIIVRGAQLSFEVQSHIPILTARIGGRDRDVTVPAADGVSRTKPRLFARPMQLEKEIYNSKLEIALKRKSQAEEILLDAEPIIKNLPPSIWGKYSSRVDMSSLDENMLQHVMGYCLSVPPKEFSQEKLPPICVDTFNVVDVGKKTDNQIPAVPPVKFLDDNGRFHLLTTWDKSLSEKNLSSGLGSDNDQPIVPPAVCAQDVFDFWDVFKATCTGGGS
ncbi:hypothetical protein FNAPI_10411 [Fusarium napiforme]|uniref:DUF6603 domain-containing protein n=1 Tax=Fusarium napiforme TaxID=42672 RepID=A0A8H5IRY7_9HYPO|nr:hypothetical protein FNAPI_10411 [Fusarium napiforme]